MLFLRSLLFQIAFYLNFTLRALITPFALAMPPSFALWYATQWMRSVLVLWKGITGSTYEFRGLEHIPQGGFIAAAKHQSAWETMGLGTVLTDFTFIMKQELMYIPGLGGFCRKSGMIPIRRSEGQRAVGPMLEAAAKAIENGRQIVIFMEGTRVRAGAAHPYKAGVARMAQKLGCPIVPVALNTGLFWPRNSFWRYPGHVIVEFLPPIMPEKMGIREMLKKLEHDVETASNALILETARAQNPPPTIGPALGELAARGIDISAAR